jgi:hypothetical protein
MEPDVNKSVNGGNSTAPSLRRIGVLILGSAGALGVIAALIYRIFWPWTGMRTDLIFATVAVVGVVALRVAKKLR